MSEHDPIFDLFLEELLTEQAPPNLSARILAAHQHQNQSIQSASVPSVANGVSVAIAASSEQSSSNNASPNTNVVSARTKARKARRTRFAISMSLSLMLFLAIGGFAYWGVTNFVITGDQPIAIDNPSNSIDTKPKEHLVQAVPGTATQDTNQVVPESRPPKETTLVASNNTNPQVIKATLAVAKSQPSATLTQSDEQVIQEINNLIADNWNQSKIKPANQATDEEWCRRTYLRLLGRIPSVDELNKYTSRRARDKQTWLVDRILSDKLYTEEFASYWGARWANVLVGRSGGMQKDSSINRESLEQYLASHFAKNTPYNYVVQDLLTATGSTTPDAKDFNPATNFLVSMLDDKATLATSKACEVFLGQRLQCIQCHNHPSNDWKQDRFWQLNAFFRQSDAEKIDDSQGYRIADHDFSGEGGDANSAEVYFEELNGRVQVAYPRFVDNTEIPRSGKLNEVNRREQLASLITTSNLLPKATVNRVWQHFLGIGFTVPIDDMGPHNPPSHPELLNNLADHFAASGYDFKRLMKWITLSEAYGLSSQAPADQFANHPELNYPQASGQLFARYYSRQMEAEQLFHSLTMVAKSGTKPLNIIADARDRQQWLGQFARKMDDDEASEDTSFDGSISQSLEMMNGQLMHKATNKKSGVLLGVISSKMTPAEKVDHLFLAALSRHPSKKENKAIEQILQKRQHELDQSLQDIWWALLNSNEFILDH
jgi:hypothetical protein